MGAIGLTALFAMAPKAAQPTATPAPPDKGIAITWFGAAAIIVAMIAGIGWSKSNDQRRSSDGSSPPPQSSRCTSSARRSRKPRWCNDR